MEISNEQLNDMAANAAQETSVTKKPRYEITVSSKPRKDVPLSVMIDRLPELMVPGHVAISVGNKAVMYRKYLDKTLFDEKNKQRLLNFMVHLHDKGLEVGAMHLVCGCKFRFHANVLKEFLVENMDTFSSLISYLVPGSKNVSMLTDAAGPSMPKATLSPEDMAQIQALIDQDKLNVHNVTVEETDAAVYPENSSCIDRGLHDPEMNEVESGARIADQVVAQETQ